METNTKPKIFIAVDGRMAEDLLNGIALAEDGMFLGGHCSSSEGFVRLDMGLRPDHDWTKKNERYAAHYPGGYELVDLVDLSHDQLGAHAGFMAAVNAAKERASQPASTSTGN